MLFFKTSIEIKSILSRTYGRPESLLFFKNSIEHEPILNRRYACPESMLSDAGRLQEFPPSSASPSQGPLEDHKPFGQIFRDKEDITMKSYYMVINKSNCSIQPWFLAWKYGCPESIVRLKNSMENKLILSRRYDCPESMLFFFKNSIENKLVVSRTCGCPESMLFFKNSIETN